MRTELRLGRRELLIYAATGAFLLGMKTLAPPNATEIIHRSSQSTGSGYLEAMFTGGYLRFHNNYFFSTILDQPDLILAIAIESDRSSELQLQAIIGKKDLLLRQPMDKFNLAITQVDLSYQIKMAVEWSEMRFEGFKWGSQTLSREQLVPRKYQKLVINKNQLLTA